MSPTVSPTPKGENAGTNMVIRSGVISARSKALAPYNRAVFPATIRFSKVSHALNMLFGKSGWNGLKTAFNAKCVIEGLSYHKKGPDLSEPFGVARLYCFVVVQVWLNGRQKRGIRWLIFRMAPLRV